MVGISPVIVLYARDVVVTRQCYETVGLAFVEEKHGDGPEHVACDLGGAVIEIYPLRDGVTPKPCDSVALVLYVESFERTLLGLKAMDLKPGKVTFYLGGTGLRASSFRDPDGRLVRLLERDPCVVQ